MASFNSVFLKLRIGRLPGLGDGPIARSLLTYDNTNREETQIYIHTSSGIRNRDPSIRAIDESTRLGQCAQYDRRNIFTYPLNIYM
jgi:hypothetical protein